MVQVAVMGFGVVGSGVVELLDKNSRIFEKNTGVPVRVKRILDLRDFPGNPYEALLTKDFNEIVSDPEISIVVECIGGVGKSYEFTKASLLAGKNVVTSNKALVAAHGPELLKIAQDQGVQYLFEASVGGGIPIIDPLCTCLAANEVTRIVGILNGTTNFILTKMMKEHMSFDVALKQAQELGYAEQDPTADVEGHDTCRKIAILASLSYGRQVPPECVKTTGISALTLADLESADRLGYVIRLLGMAEKHEDGTVSVLVSPFAVPKSHPLAGVEDVFNGIMVTGNAVGDVMFYGRGAGKFPTASAVCADVITCVKGIDCRIYWENEGTDFIRTVSVSSYLPDTEIPIFNA